MVADILLQCQWAAGSTYGHQPKPAVAKGDRHLADRCSRERDGRLARSQSRFLRGCCGSDSSAVSSAHPSAFSVGDDRIERSMNRHEPPSDSSGSATRREFLRGSLATAAIAATGRVWADAHQTPLPAPDESRGPASRVVRVTSDHVMPVRVPQLTILRDMLEVALTDLSDTKTTEDAWRAILKPDDVILLKFNRSGRSLLQPSSALAHVLTESIVSAGWSPDQLVVMEAGDNYPVTSTPAWRRQGGRCA